MIASAGNLFTGLLTLTLCLGCSRESPPAQAGPISASTVVARVDTTEITLGQVLLELNNLSNPALSLEATPENALNEIIYRKLAFAATEKYRDYDKAEVQRTAKNRTHDVLMQYLYQNLIGKQAEVADSSVDSIYRVNIAEYTIPERRRVTHLLMSDNPKAWEAAGIDITGLSPNQLGAKAKEFIDEYYRQIQAGADIADLAAKYTHDTGSKPKRGDSGLFKHGDMVDEFDKVAFKLPKGKVSAPFKSSIYGWHILRVDEIVDSTVRPLDAALRQGLYRQLKSNAETRIASKFVDSVSTKATFEWNESLLQKNIGEYEPTEWVCVVNVTDTVDATMLKDLELLYRTRTRTSEVTAEIRKQLLLGKMLPFVLSSVAKQLGYADRDTMKQAYRDAYQQEIVNRIYRDRTPASVNPSDDEMKQFYEKHIDEFKSDKPLKIQQIIFKDSVDAAKVKLELERGADFKELAMKHYPGEPDFKQAAIDLGWISREEISPEFYDAAWITEKGKYAGPVKTQWGYHLIKVVDRKSMLEFEAARLNVKQMIQAEAVKKKSEEWAKWLMGFGDVVKYDDILKQADFSDPTRYFQVADSLQKAAADTAASGS
jgi:peptidyl-prolyl cis-trans isomerase C